MVYILAGKTAWEVEQQQLAKVRSLADKWREVSRRIELWVEIQVFQIFYQSTFFVLFVLSCCIRFDYVG